MRTAIIYVSCVVFCERDPEAISSPNLDSDSSILSYKKNIVILMWSDPETSALSLLQTHMYVAGETKANK